MIATTSPSPSASLIRSASSRAWASNGLSAAAPERSSRRVPESIRVRADASGTSFTKTATFTGGGSYRAAR